MIKNFKDLISKLQLFEERQTAKSFISAVVNGNISEASLFVSRKISSAYSIDFERLAEVFESFGKGRYKCVKSVNASENASRLKLSLALVEDGAFVLMHLYMINEPNENSRWKIYGIEMER